MTAPPEILLTWADVTTIIQYTELREAIDRVSHYGGDDDWCVTFKQATQRDVIALWADNHKNIGCSLAEYLDKIGFVPVSPSYPFTTGH